MPLGIQTLQVTLVTRKHVVKKPRRHEGDDR